MIVYKALGGPVVRVGVGVARPLCGGRPCCPAEEGNQLAYLLGVSNSIGTKSKFGGGFTEESPIIGAASLERVHLGIGID